MKSFKAIAGLLVILIVYFNFPSKTNFKQEGYRIHNIGGTVANVFLLAGDKNILIDAGVPGQGSKIVRKLSKRGIDQGDLDLIIISHAHYDHAGSAAYLQSYFNAPVLVGLNDAESIKKGISKTPIIATKQKWLAKFAMMGVKDTYDAVNRVTVMPKSGVLSLKKYGFDGEVREVGGHTAGSLVIEMADGNVFVGDLIRGSFFPILKKRPRIHLYMEDNQVAYHTMQDILSNDPVQIFCGHGGPLKPKKLHRFLQKHQSFYLDDGS